MANQNFCRVVSVILLTVCMHAGLVEGRLYSNSLKRYGTNVCEENKLRSWIEKVKSSYVGYTTYYTSCGLFGWSRCKRSRQKTVYYMRDINRHEMDTYLNCCGGWRRNGDVCTIPICNSGCNHGRCVDPDTCSCDSGWTGSSCSQDVNECSSNNGGCQQVCINRIGSSSCSCAHGYKMDTRNVKKCTDIDECNLGNVCKCAKGTNENCGARCRNTAGSYRCSCRSGYRLVGSSVCADIDECATNKGGCLHQCVNSPGSFRCVCRRGFRMVDNRCQDVDECENSNGFCEQTCQNLVGRHRCKCKKGFVLDPNRRTCSDIDECSVFHGCEDQCHNTLGGYYCACSKGYELSKDETTCTDVDECASQDIVGTNKTASLADCQQKCINNEGSFTCDCNQGFKLMYDKKRCQDVDECKSGSRKCEQGCINTYGSYLCSCRVGYKLGADRRTCEGLPCEQIVSPRHGKMICLGLVTNSTCSFSCIPGYNMVGSHSRTCLTTSRWSGNTTSCEAKQCKKLVPRIPGQSISVPCYNSFGSTCRFGCGPGLYLKGDGSANCTLSEAGDGSVEWKIGQFDCEEVQTCTPNPCRHGGNCTALDEKRFTCNCDGTGYKGDTCQTGYITTPTFTKLHPRKKSKVFRLVARPEDGLRISLYSDKGITFAPSTSLNITFPDTKQEFTVEAEKPGIRTISYTLEGSSKDDFEIPEQSVVFVSPEMSTSESLYTKLFLLKKELPIGCEERKTNLYDCELRLLSTAPWTGNPLSTRGIVHIATDNGNNIPLSLIGLRLQGLQLSREKMTEASIAMTSSNKEFDVSYSNSGSCSTKKGKPDNLLELMEADTLASAFLQSLTKTSPGWLRLVMGDSSDVFDIRNVFVNVESSTLSDVEHCSGLPLKPKRSIAYFKPVINYKMFVGRDEVSLLADGKTCFVVDICKPAVFLRFPNDQTVKLRNALSFLRHMKQRNLDLRVRSVGLLNDAETINIVQGVFWNGSDLTRTPSFRYNLWLRGDVEWKMEIPGKLKVTIQTAGESFVYYDGLDDLFHDRFTKALKFHLKGNTLVTISGRTLGKDFVLPIKVSNFVGMGLLGGATNCRDSTPGISFAFGKSASRVILNSPLAPYIQPVKDQQMHLTVFVQVQGGLQDQVANKRDLRRILTNLRYLVPEFEQILEDTKSFLPEEKITLDKWIKLSTDFEKSIREIRRVLFLNREIDFAKLRRLISDIDNKIDDSGKIVELLKNRLESLPDQSAVADLLIMIEDFQFGFPRSLTIQFAGQLVQVNFQGISFHYLARLCLETLCFDDINATVDYLADNNTCLPDSLPLSRFNVRGKASRMLSLSPGKILTISSGQSITMTFDRNSDHVSASFDARLRLLGVSRDVNVALEKTQLSFQTNGDIFRQFPTDMNVIATVKPGQDWNSLVFSVNGKMLKSSLLPSLLENKIKESIHAQAEKAARRVQKVQNAAHDAQRRTIEAKNQLQESNNKLLKASDEFRTKQLLLNKHRSEYEQAKLQLNSTLMYYIKLKSQSVCELQNCSYVDTNACIPKICRKNMTVEYPVPDCSKVKKEITVDVIVQKVLTDWYWVPTFTSKQEGNCGSKNWFSKAFTGCDSYLVTVKGPQKKVSYKKYINFRESKTREIKVFKCKKPKYEKVFLGYDQPFECCDRDSGDRVKILDPKCVAHNTECFNNMTDFAENIRIENYTLFQEFQDMMHKGEIVTLAQLDVNKAKTQVDFLSKQAELVQAFYKQQEYAEDSVNVTRITSREELGLRLGEKMERLGVKRLVTVEGLSFSTTLTSTTKTLLPLVASLKTAEGGDSTIEFPMNFKDIEFSLNLASKRIIESLYGTSNSRKRRSSGQESLESILDDPSLETNLRSCLLAKKANVFFTDIIQSLEFVVVTTKKLEKEMAASVHDFDKLSFKQHEAQGSGSNIGKKKPAASHQIRAAFGEMIQSLKEAQNNSSARTSWNTTLEHWRGYLDVTTREKNLTECSGSKDCVDYFFDTLRDLYEFEDNPRAVQIKQMLRRLEQTIDGLLDENTPLHVLEETIANAKDLLNKTNDDVILCGAAPVIVKGSPARITALEGGTVELTCEVMSAIEVQHLWKKDGQVIEDFTGSKPILRNVTFHNEGAYTCEVSNKRGSVTSNVTMLIVHQKPNITENPHDLQVLLGSATASMVCNCSGTPRPSVEWFFIPMKSQTGQAVSLNFTEPVLTLFNLTFEDAGFYYCNATNLYQEVQSRIARLDVLGFTPGTTRVSLRLAIELAQCAAEKYPNEITSNCSEITSPKSQQYDSGAFQFTLNEITRYMDWSSKRVEAFKYDPPPNTSISFVVNGPEPTIPEDGTSRYLKALDAFSKSQRSLAFDVMSFQSALQEGKVMYQWRNTKIQGRAGSLTMEVLPQKCSAGKEPQQNGFLCTDCTAGSYGLSNGTCLPCPVGYYQPDQGRAKCTRCSYETLTSKPAFIPWGRCIDSSTACKASEIPKVYNVTQPNKERKFYGSGEILVLKCQPGYKEKGNATLVCNRGNWTVGHFQCERTCTSPWTELNKRCYKVIDVPTRRWKDAFGACLRLKSHMAIIKSQEENDFVAKLAKSKIRGPAYTRMWLGLKRSTAKSLFKWTDGSTPTNYTNWIPGEPNNSRGREFCTEMVITNSFWLDRWNDMKCDDRRFKAVSVCEKALKSN